MSDKEECSWRKEYKKRNEKIFLWNLMSRAESAVCYVQVVGAFRAGSFVKGKNADEKKNWKVLNEKKVAWYKS